MSFIISWTCSNSCALSQRCHPMISSSVIPYSSCLQSFPALGSFLMNQLFASGGQSIGASVSASVIPINIQDLFPLALTGLMSLLFKGLSRVFSSTTIWKHQFCGTQHYYGPTLTSVHNYWKKTIAMTNLYSVLKNRDITLPTKVCLVKAMICTDVRVGW